MENDVAFFCGQCRAETAAESAGGTGSLNGIGTKIYKSWHSDTCKTCGSSKTTKFMTIAFIPFLVLGQYRVIWLPKRLFRSQRYVSRKLVVQPSGWRRHWLPVAWLVVVLSAVLLGEFGPRTPATDVAGPSKDLKVGECFDVPTSGSVGAVQHRSCTNPHDAEAFNISPMPGRSRNEPYPDIATFQSFVRAQCVPAYASYTGRAFDTDKTYDMRYLAPSSLGWAKGENGVICYVIRTDKKPMTASVAVAH